MLLRVSKRANQKFTCFRSFRSHIGNKYQVSSTITLKEKKCKSAKLRNKVHSSSILGRWHLPVTVQADCTQCPLFIRKPKRQQNNHMWCLREDTSGQRVRIPAVLRHDSELFQALRTGISYCVFVEKRSKRWLLKAGPHVSHKQQVKVGGTWTSLLRGSSFSQLPSWNSMSSKAAEVILHLGLFWTVYVFYLKLQPAPI